MRGGLVWSHLLASILGGLVVAGVLLAFGEIGKQRTQTVPINYASAPPMSANGAASGSSVEQIYNVEGAGVVLIRARLDRRITSPFIAGAEPAGATVLGSGFLVSRQGSTGFILTTCHELEGADPTAGITVEFNTQTTRHAEVIDCQPADDVGLLKVTDMHGVSASISALNLGDSRSVSVGSSVLAIANPFGLQRTLSSGIVAAQQRQLTAADSMTVSDVLQTDMPASPGSDGSPLMDASGTVVGINSQIEVASGARTYAVSFAVPIDTARALVPKGVLP